MPMLALAEEPILPPLYQLDCLYVDLSDASDGLNSLLDLYVEPAVVENACNTGLKGALISGVVGIDHRCHLRRRRAHNADRTQESPPPLAVQRVVEATADDADVS